MELDYIIDRKKFDNRILAEQVHRQMRRRRAVFCLSCGCGPDDRQFIIDGMCHICMEVESERR